MPRRTMTAHFLRCHPYSRSRPHRRNDLRRRLSTSSPDCMGILSSIRENKVRAHTHRPWIPFRHCLSHVGPYLSSHPHPLRRGRTANRRQSPIGRRTNRVKLRTISVFLIMISPETSSVTLHRGHGLPSQHDRVYTSHRYRLEPTGRTSQDTRRFALATCAALSASN